MSVTFALRRTV